MRTILKRICSKMEENRGDTLISVMIAISLAGMLAVLLARMHENNQKVLKKSVIDSELVEIRSLFPVKMPCTAESCAKQKVLVDAHRIGRWHFQGLCSKNDLYVYTTKFREDDKEPITDPIKKIPMQWRPLFTAANGFYCTIIPIVGDSITTKNKANSSSDDENKVLKDLQEQLKQLQEATKTTPAPSAPTQQQHQPTVPQEIPQVQIPQVPVTTPPSEQIIEEEGSHLCPEGMTSHINVRTNEIECR